MKIMIDRLKEKISYFFKVSNLHPLQKIAFGTLFIIAAHALISQFYIVAMTQGLIIWLLLENNYMREKIRLLKNKD